MTTLNTIIEEEKEKARKQFDDSPVSLRIDALERYAHVHGWSQFEGRTIQDEIDTIVTTAMQRAYEAGCETSKWDMDNEYARGYNDGAYETRKLNSCAQPHRKKPTKGV